MESLILEELLASTIRLLLLHTHLLLLHTTSVILLTWGRERQGLHERVVDTGTNKSSALLLLLCLRLLFGVFCFFHRGFLRGETSFYLRQLIMVLAERLDHEGHAEVHQIVSPRNFEHNIWSDEIVARVQASSEALLLLLFDEKVE